MRLGVKQERYFLKGSVYKVTNTQQLNKQMQSDNVNSITIGTKSDEQSWLGSLQKSHAIKERSPTAVCYRTIE